MQSINVIQHINRSNDMIISTNAEKAFDKNQHHFMRAVRKLRTEGMFLNIIKGI
jgi:chorismate mutase